MSVLVIAALSEATLGAALLLDPPIAFRLLLGAEGSAAGLVMGRVAGIALLGFSLACWPDRDAGTHRPAHRAMLFYNTLATLYLVHIGVEGEWVGPLLWPAAVLHAVLTIWFFVVIRRPEAPPGEVARKVAAGAEAAP